MFLEAYLLALTLSSMLLYVAVRCFCFTSSRWYLTRSPIAPILHTFLLLPFIPYIPKLCIVQCFSTYL